MIVSFNIPERVLSFSFRLDHFFCHFFYMHSHSVCFVAVSHLRSDTKAPEYQKKSKVKKRFEKGLA